MKIGIILTGHGNFSSGLLSSINMIVGDFDNIKIVEFLEEDNYEDLDDKFLKSYELLANLDYILVMTDILGGTPFNRAYLSLKDKENVRFLNGANFNLIYYALTGSPHNIDEFIKEIITKSRESIMEYN